MTKYADYLKKHAKRMNGGKKMKGGGGNEWFGGEMQGMRLKSKGGSPLALLGLIPGVAEAGRSTVGFVFGVWALFFALVMLIIALIMFSIGNMIGAGILLLIALLIGGWATWMMS